MQSKTLDWVKSMENPSGGLSAWMDGYKAASYPECTGYIIPTLYDYREGALAGRCADWLCSIQKPEGWFGGIHIDTPQTFDTAAILEGLTRAYEETGKGEYLSASQKASDWLWSVRDDNTGTLPTEPGKETKCYTARAAWIMGDYEAADNWLPKSAWDARWGEKQRPHYIAYLLEGLHNLGYNLSPVLDFVSKFEGMAPFYCGANWIPLEGTDTSATIQMAIVLHKNGYSIDNILPAIQGMVTDCGGLKHSAGESRMTIWTAKYYLDLMKLL